jgi:hypothetical protein
VTARLFGSQVALCDRIGDECARRDAGSHGQFSRP